MLEIKSVHNAHLRISEHFQIHTEFKDLVVAETPEKLGIAEIFAIYLLCYANEDEAMKKILKNITTDDIEDADGTRDNTFSGLEGTNHAALKHFDPAVAEAARQLQVVFKTYGNLAIESVNEETADVYNLVQELKGNYAAQVEKVGLGGWVAKLEADNKAVDALVKKRNDENTAKTQLKTKAARAETDKAYQAIVKRINALIEVNGEENYVNFVTKLNGYIDKYNGVIALRKGMAAAKK
jgi:hypothetical protein